MFSHFITGLMTFPTLSTHSHLALCQMEPHLTLRTILIVHGTHSTRCWKQSSENLVHIIIIASHCCCRFVGCTSMMWITCFSADRSGNCSNISVCVFINALLYPLIVMSDYLRYCCLFIGSLTFFLWPLASMRYFLLENCTLLDILSKNLADDCVVNFRLT